VIYQETICHVFHAFFKGGKSFDYDRLAFSINLALFNQGSLKFHYKITNYEAITTVKSQPSVLVISNSRSTNLAADVSNLECVSEAQDTFACFAKSTLQFLDEKEAVVSCFKLKMLYVQSYNKTAQKCSWTVRWDVNSHKT